MSLRTLCLILLAFIFIPIKGVFAEECGIRADLPTGDELRNAVNQCLEARKPGGNPNSISKFLCPQADFKFENGQAANDEVVSYLVAANIAFNTVDENIKEYMKSKLWESREKDATKWLENIRVCVNGLGGTGTGIAQIYQNICAFGTLESLLNTGSNKKYIVTTNAYPQALCQARANMKTQGWLYLAHIQMADGLNKSQKNDIDKWVTDVKWSYGRVLSLWHTYQKMLTRSVEKMTGYNRQTN